MARITLVTGGARSGKSDFAQLYAEDLPGPHCFIATCQSDDIEMSERIAKHKATRGADIWTTREEGVDLVAALRQKRSFSTYLIDCLTLWVSNVMEKKHNEGDACTENDIALYLEEVFTFLETISSNVIFVTNEVGMGIVPQNTLARNYRDLVGRCNRLIASEASEVIFVSCGLPLYLKK